MKPAEIYDMTLFEFNCYVYGAHRGNKTIAWNIAALQRTSPFPSLRSVLGVESNSVDDDQLEQLAKDDEELREIFKD